MLNKDSKEWQDEFSFFVEFWKIFCKYYYVPEPEPKEASDKWWDSLIEETCALPKKYIGKDSVDEKFITEITVTIVRRAERKARLLREQRQCEPGTKEEKKNG